MSNLNVYLLESDSTHLEYGVAYEAVVVAVDPEDARMVMFENSDREHRWFHPHDVTITVIAENPVGERGIILIRETAS